MFAIDLFEHLDHVGCLELNRGSITGANLVNVSTTVRTRIFLPIATGRARSQWRMLVCLNRRTPVIAQPRVHPTLRRLVPELQTQVFVKSVDALGIDRLPLTPEQHVNPSLAVAHTHLGNLLDVSCCRFCGHRD